MRRARHTLALLALALFGAALAAPSASASSNFNAEITPIQVAGTQVENHVFTFEDGITLKCKKATFGGEETKPAETMTLAPKVAECTLAGFAATISVNGCTYVLHAGAKSSETIFSGTMDVSCPEGKSIAITAAECEITVPSQSGLGGVEYINKPSAEPNPNFETSVKLSTLKYKKAKDGGACPLTGTGEKEGGSYSGRAVLTGSFEGAGVGMEVQDAAKTKLCKEDPMGAACKNAYGPATAIKGEVGIALAFGTQTLACPKSVLTASTKAEAEAPLTLENVSITFPNCMLGKNNCTNVALTKNTTGSLYAWKQGIGHIQAAASMVIECPGVKCQYGSANLAMVFVGPGDEIRLFAQAMGKEKLTGEGGCEGSIFWALANYALSAPTPVWVST